MRFGELVKDLRLKQRKSLRSFSLQHGYDPGNHSKLERGLIKPPQDSSSLKKLALSLGLTEESEKWMLFFDLASIDSGLIPDYIMTDEQVLDKLPVFFRTIKGGKISMEKLDKLVKSIKGE